MTKEMLFELRELFSRITQFYFGSGRESLASAGVDAGECSEYIAALKEIENTPRASDGSVADDADDMLLYTVGRIKDAFLDKNYRLAGMMASVGGRLVGVYTFPCLSRKKFFQKYVEPLRDTEGHDLYAALEERFLSLPNVSLVLKPSFSARTRDGRYFDADPDTALMEAHPVVYTLFGVLGSLLFIWSIIGYGLLTPIKNGWLVLGFFGGALFGTGLFSLLMAWIHQYMGHKATALLLVLGAALMGLSVLLGM